MAQLLNITFFTTPSHIEKKERDEERREITCMCARHTYEEEVYKNVKFNFLKIYYINIISEKKFKKNFICYNNGMKIRYLKTTESFEIVVPDPLNESEIIVVKVSDYDLVCFLNGLDLNGYDDDTKLGLKKLCEKYFLSVRILELAKRQQHLRALNRVDSSWVDIRLRKRKPRENFNNDRLDYLRENFDSIALNCVKHEWFYEFYRLCKDVYPSMNKTDIIEKYRIMKS